MKTTKKIIKEFHKMFNGKTIIGINKLDLISCFEEFLIQEIEGLRWEKVNERRKYEK